MDLQRVLAVAAGALPLARQRVVERNDGGVDREDVAEVLQTPLVADAGLEVILLAENRDVDLVAEVSAEDLGLLLWDELAAFAGPGNPWASVAWVRMESRFNWSNTLEDRLVIHRGTEADVEAIEGPIRVAEGGPARATMSELSAAAAQLVLDQADQKVDAGRVSSDA